MKKGDRVMVVKMNSVYYGKSGVLDKLHDSGSWSVRSEDGSFLGTFKRSSLRLMRCPEPLPNEVQPYKSFIERLTALLAAYPEPDLDVVAKTTAFVVNCKITGVRCLHGLTCYTSGCTEKAVLAKHFPEEKP